MKFSSKTDDELNINAQAKCLLEALANVISRLEDVAKTDQYVNTLLKRLIKFKHGIPTVKVVMSVVKAQLLSSSPKQNLSN
jgi:hypothetical protein